MSIDIALNLSVSLAFSSSTHCYGEKKKLRSDSSLTQLVVWIIIIINHI